MVMTKNRKSNITLIIFYVLLCQLHAFVCAAIIYENTFHTFCHRLLRDRLKASLHIGFDIINWDNDGNLH